MIAIKDIEMPNELKPCPFCGGEDIETIIIDPPYGFNIPYRYGVFCPKCHAGNRYFDSKTEAIAAWNRRVSDASIA